jgi:hypothetical protein
MTSSATGSMSVVSCQLSVDSWQLSVVSCQLSVVSCQLSGSSCQLSVVSCQLSVVSCHLSVVICQLLFVSCHLTKDKSWQMTKDEWRHIAGQNHQSWHMTNDNWRIKMALLTRTLIVFCQRLSRVSCHWSDLQFLTTFFVRRSNPSKLTFDWNRAESGI